MSNARIELVGMHDFTTICKFLCMPFCFIVINGLVEATTPITEPVLSKTGDPLDPFAKSAVIAIRGTLSPYQIVGSNIEMIPLDTV